jgi:hypothetical protein
VLFKSPLHLSSRRRLQSDADGLESFEQELYGTASMDDIDTVLNSDHIIAAALWADEVNAMFSNYTRADGRRLLASSDRPIQAVTEVVKNITKINKEVIKALNQLELDIELFTIDPPDFPEINFSALRRLANTILDFVQKVKDMLSPLEGWVGSLIEKVKEVLDNIK